MLNGEKTVAIRKAMKPQRNAKGHFIKVTLCTCHPESPFLWNVNKKPSLMSLTEPAWKLKLAAQATEALQERRDNGTNPTIHLPGSQVYAYSGAVSNGPE
jgi:hypothetical protein